MACACEKSGDRKKGDPCAHCKEAKRNGWPSSRHNCSSYGTCD